ncbi:hypothetical protein TraAM80_07793 [Trypanosoma rangeli]|uniref:Uncharacterized protein n=1 Tax=Trypanosoma rangeli TaxID=5698 RepID=A0A3R7MCK7_TRYRA|nr:uncharacterized protein TraAM80_07793 [Trypanosoma rangeli]RNF00110.1 hypothetical protein TraAM80_07793 [Trypanosoma rangeli]|eukprot:RNF00110.1 hypothetical protein TraAM80_07793 [Trypanosoma rangeli]
MKRWSLCLSSFQRLPFGIRSPAGGINLNKGLLSDKERGDPFTEPTVYRSKKSITAMNKVLRKTERLRREEKKKEEMNALGVDSRMEKELINGAAQPLQKEAIAAVRVMDEERLTSSDPGSEYTTALQRLMEREVDRREHMVDKFGQPPTAKEFHKLFTQLRHADDEAETIERHQTRLVEEYGIYPSMRLDAYMLDDDTYFPEWVKALPYSIRDRVKYGSLGLTEEDEALRVTLGRMPLDRRRLEWDKQKKAREYKAAKEETLTLAELRDARQGKRRFHWLQRKRQKRASMLRRLALRKPEAFELWPSALVDYSQRIAFIAQHVENGLDTKGQWPLDPEELARARVRRSQEEAERTFLLSTEEKKALKRKTTCNNDNNIMQMLHALDTPEKPFRRLSRKVYANRVNAIVHGDQDEYGRKYRKMENRARRRIRPYESLGEMALSKEVRKEPRVYANGLNHTDDEHWPKHTKSWADGMPSIRYAA